MPFDFGKFTGNTLGEAAAFAAGIAIAPLLEPVVQELRNQTWAQAPDKPLDADVVAQAVAEGVLKLADGQAEAKLTGIAPTPFGILADLSIRAPSVAEALTLLRRNAIAPPAAQVSTADLHLAYKKAALDPLWWDALDALATVPLAPAQIALGIVRSIIPDPGLLVQTLDTSDSNVPRYTPVDIDAVAEAQASGITKERLRAMVGEIGLPMAVIAAAQAHFRGILTRGAYNQAVLEGDVRPEWADAYLDYARQIPTAHDFIEMRLRNYFTTDQELYDGTARHGMSEADTDVLFQVTGRPLSFHQVFIGERRGGTLGGPIGDIDLAFLDSLRKSNIRPEYYNLAWAQRYSYPAAFVLRALTTAGTLSAADTEQVLLFEGWEPGFAKQVAESWAGGPAAPAKKKLTNATIRSSWKKGNLTEAEALADIEANGLSPADARIYLFATTKTT